MQSAVSLVTEEKGVLLAKFAEGDLESFTPIKNHLMPQLTLVSTPVVSFISVLLQDAPG